MRIQVMCTQSTHCMLVDVPTCQQTAVISKPNTDALPNALPVCTRRAIPCARQGP